MSAINNEDREACIANLADMELVSSKEQFNTHHNVVGEGPKPAHLGDPYSAVMDMFRPDSA
jgi:hypothetical protein